MLETVGAQSWHIICCGGEFCGGKFSFDNDFTENYDVYINKRYHGRHVYNIKRQYAELKYLKESLPLGEVIILEDFAENFQMKHQREVMAAHWSHDTVTLFTAVVYNRSGTGDLEHKSYYYIRTQFYTPKRIEIKIVSLR